MTVRGGRSPNRMRWVARDMEISEALERFFARWSGPFGVHGEFCMLGDCETYFKAEPLAGQARLRHGLRHWFLRRPYPRLAEFENLRWLAAHGFRAAEPLAAGVRQARIGVEWQFLFTKRFRKTEPLVIPGTPAIDRRVLELAREVARMHDLGFVHRDLHLRNLAWRQSGPAPHVLFYDAWRGGARVQSRGFAYDLTCVSRGLLSEWGPISVRRFLAAYLSARTHRGGLQRLVRQLDRAQLTEPAESRVH